jgi:hypothetical protein
MWCLDALMMRMVCGQANLFLDPASAAAMVPTMVGSAVAVPCVGLAALCDM